MNTEAARKLKYIIRGLHGIKRMLPFGSTVAITIGMVLEKLEEAQIKLLGEDGLR